MNLILDMLLPAFPTVLWGLCCPSEEPDMHKKHIAQKGTHLVTICMRLACHTCVSNMRAFPVADSPAARLRTMSCCRRALRLRMALLHSVPASPAACIHKRIAKAPFLVMAHVSHRAGPPQLHVGLPLDSQGAMQSETCN